MSGQSELLLIIVPTRSRPENVAKVIEAWDRTDAWTHASLIFGIDADDPKLHEYDRAIGAHRTDRVYDITLPTWLPLVPKLNYLTQWVTEGGPPHFAIGFAGDDHLPRTIGWAYEYVQALKRMGTGVVSCPDGYRMDRLPTQWAMTADIVRALGRMVPAPVEHLYCDNAVQDLAEAVGCYAYLEDVLIEHMHPIAGKAMDDDQYLQVNSPAQFRKDRAAFTAWLRGVWTGEGLPKDAAMVRKLLTSGQ